MPRDTLREGDFSTSAVQPEHMEAIREWRNAQMNILRQKSPVSRREQVAYFDREVWPDKKEKHPKNLLLIYRRGTTVIGYGGLVHISWTDSRAEVSFLLDPEKCADSSEYVLAFGTWLSLMKTLAFGDLNMRRLTAETYATRSQNLPVLEKAGFVCEGVLREHVVIDGEIHDSVLHGLNNF